MANLFLQPFVRPQAVPARVVAWTLMWDGRYGLRYDEALEQNRHGCQEKQ